MAKRFACFVAILLITGAAQAEEQSSQLKAGMPADVIAYIERNEQCNHWAGQEPVSKKREAEIAAAMAKLKCDQLLDDEDALRAAHHDDANILDRLTQADEFFSATD